MEENIRILLVEDNPNDEELAMLAFKKANLDKNVVIVRDGAEALDYIFCRGKYKENDCYPTPKIVLLDLKLPKIHGIEVLRQIKSHPVNMMIPVVILSSSNQESDIIECYELGANSYIVKPLDFDEFTEIVGQLGKYWLSLNQGFSLN
jgi:DNA-binding response OmpR family regulator